MWPGKEKYEKPVVIFNSLNVLFLWILASHQHLQSPLKQWDQQPTIKRFCLNKPMCEKINKDAWYTWLNHSYTWLPLDSVRAPHSWEPVLQPCGMWLLANFLSEQIWFTVFSFFFFFFACRNNVSAISLNSQLNACAVMQFYILACHILASHLFWQIFFLLKCYVRTAKLK